MAEATEVVRTRRIEVVDDRGRVRVMIGMVGLGEGPIFGLVVQDENGRDRAWVQHEGPAAEVGLDHEGDTVAALRVDDDGDGHLFLGGE